MDRPIAVTINGEAKRCAQGLTIAAMLEGFAIVPARVAVEHNRAIVPRALLGETPVADGDTFEIVHFVGGG